MLVCVNPVATIVFLNTRLTQSSINVRVWVKAYCRGSQSLVDTGIYHPMLLSGSLRLVDIVNPCHHWDSVMGLPGLVPLALMLDPFSPLVLCV